MRNWITGRRAAWPLAFGAILFFGFGSANADFFGLDFNGDLDCDAAEGDMGQVWSEGDEGTVFCFDLILDDLDAVGGLGLSWCVRDKNKVNFESFTYTTPTGWNTETLQNSDDNPITCPIDDEYANDENLQGKILCWLMQGTDFTFTNPIETFPAAVGTFCFTLTGTPDHKVGFLCQGPNSGWFLFGTGSGDFSDPGDICAPATATEQESWGSIKQLFR